MVKLFYILKSEKYHFATILSSRSTTPTPTPPPPDPTPKCHTDIKHGNLSMDVTP